MNHFFSFQATPARYVEEPPALVSPNNESALLVIDVNRNLLAISDAAARLIGIAAREACGQPVDQFANGALAAIPLRPKATRATTTFKLADGTFLLASIRPLIGHNQEAAGWIVTLQPVRDPSQTTALCDESPSAVNTLHGQIRHMQELITMLPQFSQHHHWQQLLMKHMEQLTTQMHQQIRQIDTSCA